MRIPRLGPVVRLRTYMNRPEDLHPTLRTPEQQSQDKAAFKFGYRDVFTTLNKEPCPRLHNKGKEAIEVPGFGCCPIDFQYSKYGRERFGHGANDWRQDPRLTVRELSMLALMNALTDKPDWNKKIFDVDIVDKWHREAVKKRLISEKAWKWCLDELRDKARMFERSGCISAYDVGSGCVKSDVLIDEALRVGLTGAVRPLQEVPDEAKDWHPRSNNQVLNHVHPSLFPLVYGRTRVLSKGGQVDLRKLFESGGQEDIARLQNTVFQEESEDGFRWRPDGSKWSTKFQWLPCEVEFRGEEGNDVRITSYINNLHPLRHKNLYGVVEKLISLSIEPWNQVLVYPDEQRTPPRIKTYGCEFDPPYPDWMESRYAWMAGEKIDDAKFNDLQAKTSEFMEIPDNPAFKEEVETVYNMKLEAHNSCQNETRQQATEQMCQAVEDKWFRIRKAIHPEPGEAYSYDDWKSGRVDKKPAAGHSFAYLASHERCDIDLAKTWRKQGLQVIVKLASIELTPEKPEYEGGNWHLEGMLNEHIVATAIYYYDVSNTTESHIRFRFEANLDDISLSYEQDDHEPLCEIFGTEHMRDEPAVQELGSISTPQGRLLAFPNTLQHRVDPFRLKDPSKPGHRRFVVLWLVDPHYRIASTRNVPPQQEDWWELARDDGSNPNQQVSAIGTDGEMHNSGEWPMTLEEAKKLRLELMDERTKLMPLVEAQFETYDLCEH